MSNARYRILRRLGQGGMAEVFEAELAGDLGFVRKVAIKRMLASAAADPSAAQRFLDEARIASHLHHANVVSVVDLGLLDNLPFQVLELVEGINAHELIQRAGGKLPLEIALAIAGDVAHALDHAHGAVDPAGFPLGIVHRDVKPSNVLVSWGGDVKLSDFGIAVAHDRAAQTEAGVVAGTLGFIAPEQRTRSQLDGRTDVFALGLTLHALATGYSPLQNLEVEMQVLVGEPVPIDAALPADVRALIERAVAPVRTVRPSASELAGAIGAALASRMTRDTRSALREFLAPFTAKRTTRAGALDQLLGIEVVLTGSSHAEDGVRRYETIALAAKSTVASPTPEHEAATALLPPQPRRVVPIVAAIGGLGLVGGIALWQLRGADVPTPIDAAVIATPADASPDIAIREIMIDAAPIVADATRPDARVTKAPPDATQLDAAAAPTGTGYLQILGDEDLVGTLVFVDGVFAGSVPNKIPVPLGKHRVEVRRRDGTQVRPPKPVTVEPFHTRIKPLEPTW